MQNVGRAISWNHSKNAHVCKFASWRLARHSDRRFIIRVQEESADRLHHQSAAVKPWAPQYGQLLLPCVKHQTEMSNEWSDGNQVESCSLKPGCINQLLKTRRCMSTPAPRNLAGSLSSALSGALNLKVCKNKTSLSAVFRLLQYKVIIQFRSTHREIHSQIVLRKWQLAPYKG